MSYLSSMGDLLSRPAWAWLLSRVRIGSVTIHLPNGKMLRRKGREPGGAAEVTLHRPGTTMRRLLSGGGVGFAESYLAGDWDTEDLAATLELAGRNLDLYIQTDKPNRFIEPVRRLWQRVTNRHGAAIESIDRHYNLGNSFYELWLDDSMTYSSAVFTSPGQTLQDAQREKYRRLAGIAQLSPEDHVLEIGCGWGGFAEHAATEIGCRVTGMTLSTEQAAYARDRAKEAGVDHLVDIKLQDFRMEHGTYDKVVSIEMIESIPADLWSPLFETIARVLRPGGRAAMQSITIADELFESLLKRDDFISKHVFPGGALPSVGTLENLGTKHRLAVADLAAYGDSYARTLHEWRERFALAWPKIAGPPFNEYFRRTWDYYLAYCEAGFTVGRIDVYQIGFHKRAR